MDAYDKKVIATIMAKNKASKGNSRSPFSDNIYGKLWWEQIEWKAWQAECVISLLAYTWKIWVPLAFFGIIYSLVT